MTFFARAFAYLAALLIAFGGVAPWITIAGEPGGASPTGLAVVSALALSVVVVTVLRRRSALAVLAVLIGALAVYAVWTAPSNPLVAASSGEAAASAGGGLSLILLGALLVYVASWIAAPPDDAATRTGGAGDRLG